MSVFNTRGDRGETSLVGGARVSKASDRVEAYGTIDELNSHLGAARHLVRGEGHAATLVEIQEDLFRVAGELATPEGSYVHPVTEADVARLSGYLAACEAKVRLEGFVIPGNNPPAAALDVARTVCRRAERRVVGLREAIPDLPVVLHQYLNRLADLLFTMARVEELADGGIRYKRADYHKR